MPSLSVKLFFQAADHPTLGLQRVSKGRGRIFRTLRPRPAGLWVSRFDPSGPGHAPGSRDTPRRRGEVVPAGPATLLHVDSCPLPSRTPCEARSERWPQSGEPQTRMVARSTPCGGRRTDGRAWLGVLLNLVAGEQVNGGRSE